MGGKGLGMGRYLREARMHADRVKHYYDWAGPLGHQQAKHYMYKLEGLVGRADRSKNDKSDVAPILALLKVARVQMEEMAKRRDEWAQRHNQSPSQEG